MTLKSAFMILRAADYRCRDFWHDFRVLLRDIRRAVSRWAVYVVELHESGPIVAGKRVEDMLSQWANEDIAELDEYMDWARMQARLCGIEVEDEASSSVVEGVPGEHAPDVGEGQESPVSTGAI
jgi:hypothetical protein